MLRVTAACLAVLLLLPGQSQGYSISLTGKNTSRSYTITQNGASSGGTHTGSYLEASVVRRTYDDYYYGTEEVPGYDDPFPSTRYKIHGGGEITAQYQHTVGGDTVWTSFNSKYYHAMEVRPGDGVFARERGVEIQSSESYHKFDSNAILVAYDDFGTYLKSSGQRGGLVSGIEDDFNVSFSISNVNIVPTNTDDYNLFSFNHIYKVNSPVFSGNAVGFSLHGDDLIVNNAVFTNNKKDISLGGLYVTINNMKYTGNEGSLDLRAEYPRSTYFMIESSVFSDNSGETALFTPHIGGDCFFDEGFIYDTKFTGNHTGFHLNTTVTFTKGQIADNVFNGQEGIRGGGGSANSLTLTDVPVTGNVINIESAQNAGAEGGGIYAGNGTFNRDTFEENVVKVKSSNGDLAEAYGGAISGSTISVSNTGLTDNAAFASASGDSLSVAHGGAILAREALSGSYVTFTGNTASADTRTGLEAFAMGGGASVSRFANNSQYVYAGSASLQNVNFTSNTAYAHSSQVAYAYGGGLVAYPKKWNQVSFTKNTASASAIRNENFRYPSVLAIGGGSSVVYSEQDVSAGNVFQLIDWTIFFLNNDTGQDESSDTLQMNTVTFEGNKAVATMTAGPLYGGQVTKNDLVAALAGGWLLRTSGSNYTMSNITITNNTAEATSTGILSPNLWAKAGGAVIAKGTGTISHLSVTGNKAAALFNLTYSTSATDTTARASSAYGGGLYLENTKLTASNGVFISNNTASSKFKSSVDTYTYKVVCETKGGGMYMYHSQLALNGTKSTQVEIANNTAEAVVTSNSTYVGANVYGGAAYLSSGSSLSITAGNVSNNKAIAEIVPVPKAQYAVAYGGAFYLDNSTLTLVDTNLTGNIAKSEMVKEDSGVTYVTSTSEGGGIYAKNSSTVFIKAENRNVVFSRNEAGSGADIRVSGAGSTLNFYVAEGKSISLNDGISVGNGKIYHTGKGTVRLSLATSTFGYTDLYLQDGGTIISTAPKTKSIYTISLDTVNINGGTIDLRDGGANSFSVSRLEAMSTSPTRLYVDFNGSPSDFTEDPMDCIHISDVNDSGGISPNIQLSGINVIKDGTAKTAYYLSGNTNKITVRDTALYAQSSGGWLYVFTPVDGTKGKLTVTRVPNDGSLPMAIGDDDIDSYSFSMDSSAEMDLGTMAGPGRTFTVFGNDHTYTAGASHTGVTVNGGQTFTIQSLRLEGFDDYAIRNSGEVHLDNVTLANNAMDIQNDGDLYLESGEIRMSRGITALSGDASAGRVYIPGADVTITAGGVLKQASVIVEGGSLTMESGTNLSVGNFELTGGSLSANGSASIGNMSINAGNLSVINGTMGIDALSLNGGTIFLDPSYMGVNALRTDLNGEVFVGAGSVLRVGDVNSLQATVENAGLSVTGTGDGFTVGAWESVLALGQSVSMVAGSNLIVDATVQADGSGTAKDAGDSAYFGPGSLFVITSSAAEAGGLQGGASGTLGVANTAKIALLNAKTGNTYTVASGFTGVNAAGSGWTGDNILLSSYIVDGTGTFTADGFTITTSSKDVRETFPNIIPVSAINTMAAMGINDVNSPEGGIRFLSRAMEGGLYVPKEDVTGMVNEVSRIAVTVNVQHTALRSLETATDAMDNHLSLARSDVKAVSIKERGWHVWATPLHSRTWTHDMGPSGNSVHGHLSGLVIGAGKIFGDLTVGLSVNGGGGYSETDGTVTDTRDSHNFGGAALYAEWTRGAWNVYGSVGVSMGHHNVKVDLPSGMGFGTQEADIYTRALYAGVNVEYLLKTPAVDIIPHVGVRYINLHVYDHDLGSIASYDSKPQNLVQFPVGVTFTKEFEVGSWSVKPMLDLSVVPTLGDTSAKTTVRFNGIPAEDSVYTRVQDDFAFKGTAGFTAKYEDFSFGLNYSLKTSSHETDHGIQASFMWEF